MLPSYPRSFRAPLRAFSGSRLFWLLLLLLTGAPAAFGQSVGIGTPTPHPSAALDVSSTSKGLLIPRMTAAARGLIAAPVPTGLLVYQTDGAQPGFWYYAATGGWTFLNPTNDNLGNHTATTNLGLNGNWLSNAPGNANGLRVDNAGNVGIGVSIPTQALDVNGGILARANGVISNQGAYLQWNRTGGEGETWLLNQKGGGNANAGIRFGAVTPANAVTEWARFLDNGNLGIGTPTPGQKLDVAGNATVSGSVAIGTPTAATLLDVRATDNSAAITVGKTDGTTGALYLGNANHGLRRNYATGNDVGLFTTSGNLYLSAAGGTSTSQLALLNGGNVGIGTATPGQKLDVAGNIGATGPLGVVLNGQDRPLITRGFDVFSSGNYNGAGRWGLFMESQVLGFGVPALPNKRFQWLTYNDNSSIAATLMALSQDGQLSIGTATPDASAALEVASTTKGLLPPRLSRSQRDALGSPATGLLIYNTTTNRLNAWNGTAWEAGLVAAEQAGPPPATMAFGFTNGPQTYVVPTGVYTLTIDARGAQGGSSNNGGPGGLGGRIVATVAVTPGETLTVQVGGAGTTAPNFNTGGAGYNGGGNSFRGGGGGGGGTDVRRGAATLTDRLVMAAGGGGGAAANDPKAGGAGGYPNGGDGDGIFSASANGDGATQTGPGAGGQPSAPAGLGQGGTTSIAASGGGGGGYWGGGGGGWYINSGLPGSGGGGSSGVLGNTNLQAAETGTNAGNGSVTITPGATYAAPVLNGSNFTSVASANGLLARGSDYIDEQGAHLQWNRSGFEGETWLLNQQGGGPGGIRFGKADQQNTVTEWARFQDNGRLGIGTANPIAPLHVKGAAANTLANGNSSFFNQGGNFTAIGNNSGTKQTTAYFEGGEVWVSGYIVAGNLNTTSDRRIKHVIGRSNRASDLALINQIRITDYTYIDQVNNTPGVVKKVIAQEVETVLPTAVSRSFQALPNVYERATRVTYANGLVTVTTAKPHELPATGGRLRLYTPANAELNPDVTVVDAHTVRFTSADAHANGLFVYGKYVDDFRSVDYDALTTLNVSATQELARKVAALEAENAALKARATTAETQAAADQAQTTATLESLADRLRALEASGTSTGQARK